MYWLRSKKSSTRAYTKKLFILLLISLFVVPAFSQSKPGILVIYVDGLGYGNGCYGVKNVQTPNIDKPAANGLRFTDAHCTAAICAPSRFSLLTCSYAFRNGAAIDWKKPVKRIRTGI